MRYQPQQQSHHFLTAAGALLVLGFAFIGYNYLSTKRVSATEDPLVSSEGDTASSSPFDAAQLDLLARMEAIKLDGSILADPNFLNLQDWTVDLGHLDAGRINPFIPYDGMKSAQSAPAPKAPAKPKKH